MPFVSTKPAEDEWRREAARLAAIVQKGPGSPHLRVEAIRQSLMATAAENFTAGKKEGESAATPVAMMGELEHLRAENKTLKAKPKVVQELPVSDADLMEAMRMADNCENSGGEINTPLVGTTYELVPPVIRKLAMEVAKLRYQAKAAAK